MLQSMRSQRVGHDLVAEQQSPHKGFVIRKVDFCVCVCNGQWRQSGPGVHSEAQQSVQGPRLPALHTFPCIPLHTLLFLCHVLPGFRIM